MSDTTLSSLLHGAEALVVLIASLVVAHFFPEHKEEALGIAVGLLSTLAKFARASDAVPMPDFVNQKQS